MPMSAFFALLVFAHLAIRLWLSARQARWVARHAGAVPAQFARTVTLDQHRHAAAYTVARQRLAAVDALVGAGFFTLLTWGGALQWLGTALGSALGSGLAGGIALVVAVVLLQSLVDLPVEWVRCFRVEQRFGFNRMTLGLFFADLLKSAALGALLGIPLLALVLALMGSGWGAWWLAAWVCWSAFTLLLTIVYPVWIAPLFNRFTPVADAELRARINTLLARTGFRASGVFTMDGSRRSSHGNAYFSGLGAAKRIVFYDTLLARLPPEEIEAVLAHELGHFRLHHIAQRLVTGLGVSCAGLALLGWLQQAPWFAPSLGVVAGPGMPMQALTLVLFAMVLPQCTFLLAPLQSALARRQEFAADAFAAREASAQDLVNALIKLYQDNAATLTPDPLHSAFYDSHPPAALRVGRLLGAPYSTHVQ